MNAKLHVQLNEKLWNQTGPWGVSTGTTYSDTGYQNTWDINEPRRVKQAFSLTT